MRPEWLFCSLFATPLVLTAAAGAPGIEPLSELDRLNWCIGTQTFGAAYRFTRETRLVETAQAILDMGSNVLKFGLEKNYFGPGRNVDDPDPRVHSLAELAAYEPSHRRVLDMPFAYYIIWAYGFTPGWWSEGFSVADQKLEYDEMRALAAHLLTTYSGSGKTFYLGHWEGDWHLRPSLNPADAVKPEAIEGMIDWLNVRQRAIDDAKRDVPHQAVEIYGYCEVNLVRIAMEGRQSVTTDVVPRTTMDYVSYSSYDSGLDLIPALDYIESKLPPKPGIPGKRVWIGEYGFPAFAHSPSEQDRLSRQVMRAGLAWGCPFVLYWEMYNNEVGKDGAQRGFWLIDDKGDKQPVYETHHAYYQWARHWATDFRAREGRLPTFDEFREAAVAYLDALPGA